jgi:hypothetical protein
MHLDMYEFLIAMRQGCHLSDWLGDGHPRFAGGQDHYLQRVVLKHGDIPTLTLSYSPDATIQDASEDRTIQVFITYSRS